MKVTHKDKEMAKVINHSDYLKSLTVQANSGMDSTTLLHLFNGRDIENSYVVAFGKKHLVKDLSMDGRTEVLTLISVE